MSSLSAVSDAMNEVYENLIRLVDIHIERLVDLEDVLDAELQFTQASMLPVPSYHEPMLFDDDDETEDESDDESIGYEPGPDDGEGVTNAIMSLSQLGMDRHVTFNNTVFEIGTPTHLTDSTISSDHTVPLNYTPFDSRLMRRTRSSDSDSDSDSDTVIVDWMDPAESPIARYMSFDDENDYMLL